MRKLFVLSVCAALAASIYACEYVGGDQIGPSQSQTVIVDQSGNVKEPDVPSSGEGVLPEGSTVSVTTSLMV